MSEIKYWQDKWLGISKSSANNFAKRSLSVIKNKKFKTLLDLGAGDGRDSLYFANKGFKVTAVDFSASGVKKIQAFNHKNIKAIKQDIKNLNLSKNSFDVIYAHLSLHYFTDKDTTKIFNQLYKILKPKGYIFIKCKSTDDHLYGKGEKVGPDMYIKGHLRHFFTKKYMQEKLFLFKIIKVRKTSSVYHSYKSSFIEAVATKK